MLASKVVKNDSKITISLHYCKSVTHPVSLKQGRGAERIISNRKRMDQFMRGQHFNPKINYSEGLSFNSALRVFDHNKGLISLILISYISFDPAVKEITSLKPESRSRLLVAKDGMKYSLLSGGGSGTVLQKLPKN